MYSSSTDDFSSPSLLNLVIGTFDMLRDQVFSATQSPQSTLFEASRNILLSSATGEKLEFGPQLQQPQPSEGQTPSQNQEQRQEPQQEEEQQQSQQTHQQVCPAQQLYPAHSGEQQASEDQLDQPTQQQMQQTQQQLQQQPQIQQQQMQQTQQQLQQQLQIQQKQMQQQRHHTNQKQQQNLNHPSQVASACSGPSNASMSGMKESAVTVLTSQISSHQSRPRVSSFSTGKDCVFCK